ncbi:hypothetical protein SSM1_204 [Synechococcus phage S-SM1]|uniref:Uncharacterized protein n=1 Tax=Synechococcus phage S-SM1 TaxID=444859 RepID=E3SIL1_9CAUD|nr:hypothetical protein SSM1_204 [Synechococcus phage S-SM1]ADO97146.1 hypothetical protein SSM1_204 [Synechococcus phage S-SM1]
MHKLLTLHIVVSSMSASSKAKKCMALSAIAVALTPSDVMEALQVTGLITLGCVAGMSLLYGEILLLSKS